MLWIYYYEDKKVNKSVDQKRKELSVQMYVHLGNLGIHDHWSVLLLSDPSSAKRKTSFFVGKMPIASGGYQFQQANNAPSYQYDLYPASLSVCALIACSSTKTKTET